MGIHRKIEIRIWSDEKFRRLSPLPPSGQSLWLYLLTGPHTGIIPGMFCAGHAAMAEALGWSLEAFDKAFAEAFREGLLKDSPKDRFIWIPNAIKYNLPASPNVVRSWASALDFLPECSLLYEAIERLRVEVCALDKDQSDTKQGLKGFAKAFAEVFPKAFDKALPKAFAKGNGNPLPNQEQEQEQDSGTGIDTAAGEFSDYSASPAGPEADPGFESAQEPAAILIKTQEVKTILTASLYRMAFKPEDFAEIATRLERDDLPTAFVTWAIKQADAAKPKSPGAFIKGALLGWKNFEDWPDKYRVAVKPDEEAARSKALAQKVIDDLAAAKAEAFDGEIDLSGAFRRQIVEKAREAAGGGDEWFEDDEAAKW